MPLELVEETAEQSSARGKKESQAALVRGFDAADLMDLDMPDPLYLARPWISEGVTLVVGRPKIGKTTLLRQLVVEVNTGGSFLAAMCDKAQVLFLSLEEGERLMRKKLKGVYTSDQLRGVRIEFEWKPGWAGVDALRERLKAEPNIRLLVIDSLTRFRPPPSRETPQFQQDYNAVKWLADLAKEFPGLAICILHHTTKANPEDPVAAISGTYGLTAAADNYLILLLHNNRFRLHCGGRLWEGDQSDYELARQNGRWQLIGEWNVSAGDMTPQQVEVLAILRREGTVTGNGIATRLGVSAQAASKMLHRMAEAGLVTKTKHGWEPKS